MIKIFIADISALDISEAMEQVSSVRREKAERLKDDSAKRRSLGAEMLLISVCGRRSYSVGKNGKPYFPDHEVHFSLAHCGDYAVCAVSDSPVGVDIELPRNDTSRLAKRFFAQDEADAAVDAESFCRIWTLKESYIKLRDMRLTDMPGFSVLSMDRFRFRSFTFGQYRIGCCSEADDDIEIEEIKL